MYFDVKTRIVFIKTWLLGEIEIQYYNTKSNLFNDGQKLIPCITSGSETTRKTLYRQTWVSVYSRFIPNFNIVVTNIISHNTSPPEYYLYCIILHVNPTCMLLYVNQGIPFTKPGILFLIDKSYLYQSVTLMQPTHLWTRNSTQYNRYSYSSTVEQ